MYLWISEVSRYPIKGIVMGDEPKLQRIYLKTLSWPLVRLFLSCQQQPMNGFRQVYIGVW